MICVPSRSRARLGYAIRTREQICIYTGYVPSLSGAQCNNATVIFLQLGPLAERLLGSCRAQPDSGHVGVRSAADDVSNLDVPMYSTSWTMLVDR